MQKQKQYKYFTLFTFASTLDTNSAIVVAGDFNDDVFSNLVINNAVATRMWTQPRQTLSEHNPDNLKPTYSKHGDWNTTHDEAPSNLDTILITASLARTLVSSNVHQNLRLSTHCAVSCELSTNSFNATFQTWVPSKPIPVERIKLQTEDQKLQHNIDTWEPYQTPFHNAIHLGLVNEAMVIWNEAAVKSLTDLIPGADYHDFVRGSEPNIVNKPLFAKNIDDIRDRTQWYSNILEACNLIRTLIPAKQAFFIKLTP